MIFEEKEGGNNLREVKLWTAYWEPCVLEKYTVGRQVDSGKLKIGSEITKDLIIILLSSRGEKENNFGGEIVKRMRDTCEREI